jgi:hypothetical protein
MRKHANHQRTVTPLGTRLKGVVGEVLIEGAGTAAAILAIAAIDLPLK